MDSFELIEVFLIFPTIRLKRGNFYKANELI